MNDKKFIRVTSHALDTSPCHTFSVPSPIERDILYGRFQGEHVPQCPIASDATVCTLKP